MSLAAVLQNSQPWHVEQIDVFAGCRLLPAASIHCIVSSPPYLGLRDYGIPPRQWDDGLVCCYGLEPDVASYVRHTVELFAEFRRILRDDGVVWWNVGDSYENDSKWGGATGGMHAAALHGASNVGRGKKTTGLMDGSKLLIPLRIAIALADAGWIVRQDNVWHKKSPMPESIGGWRWVRCRVKVANRAVARMGATTGSGFSFRETELTKYIPCPGCPKCEAHAGWVLRKGSWRHTNGHEYIFQIVKQGGYFGDSEAAAEQTTGGSHSRGNGTHPKSNSTAEIAEDAEGLSASSAVKQNGSFSAAVREPVESRNPRSVWHLASESYKGAHFATFPSELARRCLVGSCSPGGICPHCGTQFAPRVSKERVATRPGNDSKVGRVSDDADSPYHVHNGAVVGNRDPQRHINVSRTEGYAPACDCLKTEPLKTEHLPPLVLEPFTGSGTTLQVARHMGFRSIGFEVNPDYIALAQLRIEQTPRCFLDKQQRQASRRGAKARRNGQAEFQFVT